jgi:penicillin-binding protein 1A
LENIRNLVTQPETAYEVHSCLVDALQSGTGKAAFTQFGLKKIPAAGKTGTAYDFTDALFAGYDSNFTCAVWAGFDKPQKIYRGAFGRELALPIWVDIMNAAAQSYPSQVPAEPCNVHGEARARLAREFGSSDLPRAALAVNLSEITPVVIRSPTLLADKDPYNSLKPTLKPEPTPEPLTEIAGNQNVNSAAGENGIKTANNSSGQSQSSTPTTQATPEIRKAIPVAPQEKTPVEIRRAVPVKPLDQEDENQTLLRSAARPPGNPDE